MLRQVVCQRFDGGNDSGGGGGGASSSQTTERVAKIFLDSDNLVDLEKLMAEVERTRLLVLLLTPLTLTRPWVLCELIAAARANVELLVVDARVSGDEHAAADAMFERLREGRASCGAEVLRLVAGVPMADVTAHTGCDRRETAELIARLFHGASASASARRPWLEFDPRRDDETLWAQCVAIAQARRTMASHIDSTL